MACTFDSPSLPSQVKGAVPTFAFYSDNRNDFGIPASFTSGKSNCYTTNPVATNTWAPVLIAGGATYECTYPAAQQSFICPGVDNSVFPTGTATLSYTSTKRNNFTPFAPYVFVVSATPTTDTVYQTITSSTTMPAMSSVTTTVTSYSSTTTSVVPTLVTSTGTVYMTSGVQSCSSPSTSATSSAKAPVSTGASSTLTCPDSNSTFVKAPSGTVFVVACYTDYFGGDLKSVSASSLKECIDACDATPSCIDISWVQGAPGTCYMKSTLTDGIYNSNIWGAKLYSSSGSTAALPASSVAVSTTASASSASTPASPSLSCPASDGMTYITANGAKYQIECYVDREDHDMSESPVFVSTVEQCMEACASRNGCVDVSMSGTACYLKNGLGAANPNSNVVGAKLITASSSSAGSSSSATVTTSATPVVTALAVLKCPAADGMTYTDSCGATYKIECGIDYSGGDMPGSGQYVDDLDKCIGLCSNTAGCVDVSWVQGSPEGPCYFKSSFGPRNANSAVWGAKQLTGCTSKTSKRANGDENEGKGGEKSDDNTKATGYSGPDATYTAKQSGATKTVTKTVKAVVGATTAGTKTVTVSSGQTTVTSTSSLTVQAMTTSTVTTTYCPATVSTMATATASSAL